MLLKCNNIPYPTSHLTTSPTNFPLHMVTKDSLWRPDHWDDTGRSRGKLLSLALPALVLKFAMTIKPPEIDLYIRGGCFVTYGELLK